MSALGERTVGREMDSMEDDVEAATEYLADFGYVGADCSAMLGYLQVSRHAIHPDPVAVQLSIRLSVHLVFLLSVPLALCLSLCPSVSVLSLRLCVCVCVSAPPG